MLSRTGTFASSLLLFKFWSAMAIQGAWLLLTYRPFTVAGAPLLGGESHSEDETLSLSSMSSANSISTAGLVSNPLFGELSAAGRAGAQQASQAHVVGRTSENAHANLHIANEANKNKTEPVAPPSVATPGQAPAPVSSTNCATLQAQGEPLDCPAAAAAAPTVANQNATSIS
jgi:hypothetical protein